MGRSMLSRFHRIRSSALCILEIGADLVDRLKIGKFHGVSTLHPSIFTYL